MKPQDLRAALAAEQQRREQAEVKLSRALENNTALARGNLRLQEQCARLRGEADLRQHEEGCQRAAAAAREHEAASKLARLQALVRRGAEEREALLRQLDGKQEVIAYLESKLAMRAAVGGSGGGTGGQLGTGSSGAAAEAAGVETDAKAAQSSGSAADSLGAAAPAPGGRERRQRVPLVASEEEEAQSVGEEASSGSPAELQSAGAPSGPRAGDGADAEASRPGRASKQPAGEEVQQFQPTKLPSPPATAADQTPAPNKKQQRIGGSSAGAAPPTILHTWLRARNGVSYAEPSLNRKLRQGDPFTFGAAEAAAVGAGKPHGRARTKPRPRFAAGAAQHSGEERREALPPVSD